MKKGCLLIHGFTGCRGDLEPLRDHLNQLGYAVTVPVLKGHEATPNELKRASRHEWIAGAQRALDELKASCEKVVVIGFSMGGLVAANLCQTNDFDGIVFINTPVYYWGLSRLFVSRLYSDFKTNLKSSIASMRTTPLHALFEFQLLLSSTKRLFRKIRCRSLVLQSIHDDVVVPRSAQYIFSRLRGKKEMKTVPNGGHVVLLSDIDGSRQVCTDVQRFLMGF